jgi:hypothetical protein
MKCLLVRNPISHLLYRILAPCHYILVFLQILAILASPALAQYPPPSSYGAPSSSGGGYPSPSAYGVPAPNLNPLPGPEADNDPRPLIIKKHVFVHTAPDDRSSGVARRILAPIPRERQVNILFVKAPAPAAPDQQIVELPNDGGKKTLVYVLLKKADATPNVDFNLATPTQPSKPEVISLYFVLYLSSYSRVLSLYFFPLQIYFIRYKDGKKPGETPAGPPSGPPATSPQYGIPAQKQGY